MLQWFRARARVMAIAALVSLVGLGGLSSAGHGAECHDDNCATVLVPHDPSSHSVRNASTVAAHTLHCVLCHWTRSTRPSTESVHHLSRPVADTVRLPIEVRGVLSPTQAAQPPLRSPPAGSHQPFV